MAPASNFPHNRVYPTAPPPNDDVSAIGGNCTPEHKQCNVNILAYHIGFGRKAVFGHDAAKDLKLVEMNVHKRKTGAGTDASNSEVIEGQTVCEIEVKEAMLNRHGVLAGACLLHIFDITTFSALFAAAFTTGKDPTGASIAMDFQWYSAALPGTVLRIISTTLNLRGRIVSARAEVYDKKTGVLIATGSHGINPLASFHDTATRKAKL